MSSHSLHLPSSVQAVQPMQLPQRYDKENDEEYKIRLAAYYNTIPDFIDLNGKHLNDEIGAVVILDDATMKLFSERWPSVAEEVFYYLHYIKYGRPYQVHIQFDADKVAGRIQDAIEENSRAAIEIYKKYETLKQIPEIKSEELNIVSVTFSVEFISQLTLSHYLDIVKISKDFIVFATYNNYIKTCLSTEEIEKNGETDKEIDNSKDSQTLFFFLAKKNESGSIEQKSSDEFVLNLTSKQRYTETELKNVLKKLTDCFDMNIRGNLTPTEVKGVFTVVHYSLNLDAFSHFLFNYPYAQEFYTQDREKIHKNKPYLTFYYFLEQEAKEAKRNSIRRRAVTIELSTEKIGEDKKRRDLILSTPYAKGITYLYLTLKGIRINDLIKVRQKLLDLLSFYRFAEEEITSLYRALDIDLTVKEEESKGDTYYNGIYKDVERYIPLRLAKESEDMDILEKIYIGAEISLLKTRRPVIIEQLPEEITGNVKMTSAGEVYYRTDIGPLVFGDNTRNYAIKFPLGSEGIWFSSVSRDCPYIGLVAKKNVNKEDYTYDYYPMCFTSPETNLSKYYENTVIQSNNNFRLTDGRKVVPYGRTAVLPDNLDKIFQKIVIYEETFFRVGMQIAENSFLQAIATGFSLREESKISDFKPDTESIVNAMREHLNLDDTNFDYVDPESTNINGVSNLTKLQHFIQEHYNVDLQIFVFNRTEDSIDFIQGTLFQESADSIIILQHGGPTNKRKKETKVCELIFRQNGKESSCIFGNLDKLIFGSYDQVSNILGIGLAKLYETRFTKHRLDITLSLPLSFSEWKSTMIAKFVDDKKNVRGIVFEMNQSEESTSQSQASTSQSQASTKIYAYTSPFTGLTLLPLTAERNFNNNLNDLERFCRIEGIEFSLISPVVVREGVRYTFPIDYPTSSHLTHFNEMRKKASRYQDQLLYRFSVYVDQKGKRLELFTFPENTHSQSNLDSSFLAFFSTYTNTTAKEPDVVSESLSTEKIDITPSLKEKMKQFIVWMCVRHHNKVVNFKDRTHVSKHYYDVTDFTQPEADEKWKIYHRRNIIPKVYVRYDIKLTTEAYFLDVDNKVLLIQHAKNFQHALSVSDFWSRHAYNLGYEFDKEHLLKEIIPYNMYTITDNELKMVPYGEGNPNVRVLLVQKPAYKVDQNGQSYDVIEDYFCSILFYCPE